MDRQFYEFWGNFFTNAAQGQKNLDDMSTWMKQGFTGADDLATLFRRCYGLKSSEPGDTQDVQNWQRAIADFQQTFMQFGEQWGWVAPAEHQKALEKCAELEKKVQQQEDIISQLRGLLAQEGLGHTELFQHFKGALEEQNSQFQALMESVSMAGKGKS